MMRVWVGFFVMLNAACILPAFRNTLSNMQATEKQTHRDGARLDSLRRTLLAHDDSLGLKLAQRIDAVGHRVDSVAGENHRLLVTSETRHSDDVYALWATILTLIATCALAVFAWHHSKAARDLVTTIKTLGESQAQAILDEKDRRRRALQRRVSGVLEVVEQFRTLPAYLAPTPPWSHRLFDFIQDAVVEFGDDATAYADSAQQLLDNLSAEWDVDHDSIQKTGTCPPNYTANWARLHSRTVDTLRKLQAALTDGVRSQGAP